METSPVLFLSSGPAHHGLQAANPTRIESQALSEKRNRGGPCASSGSEIFQKLRTPNMNRLLENLFARLWNKRVAMRNRLAIMSGLVLGLGVSDGQVSRSRLTLAQGKLLEHITVLGKTGGGKSSFLRHLAVQDIRAGRGFVSVDLHGDMTPYLLGSIAEEEQRRHQDLQ